MSAGQEIGSPIRENRTLLPAPLPPDEARGTLAAAAGVSTVGLRPPFDTPAAAFSSRLSRRSHLDCRAALHRPTARRTSFQVSLLEPERNVTLRSHLILVAGRNGIVSNSRWSAMTTRGGEALQCCFNYGFQPRPRRLRPGEDIEALDDADEVGRSLRPDSAWQLARPGFGSRRRRNAVPVARNATRLSSQFRALGCGKLDQRIGDEATPSALAVDDGFDEKTEIIADSINSLMDSSQSARSRRAKLFRGNGQKWRRTQPACRRRFL